MLQWLVIVLFLYNDWSIWADCNNILLPRKVPFILPVPIFGSQSLKWRNPSLLCVWICAPHMLWCCVELQIVIRTYRTRVHCISTSSKNHKHRGNTPRPPHTVPPPVVNSCRKQGEHRLSRGSRLNKEGRISSLLTFCFLFWFGRDI